MTTMKNHRNLITAVFLMLSAFLIYQTCINSTLIEFDDRRILEDHPELYDHPTLTASFKSICFHHYPREEPLLVRDLSWALDAHIFGFHNPKGYHFSNVLFHAVVISLFFFLIIEVTNSYSVALLASIMALSLAVHVEPVAWVMGRKDILASGFGLLAMLSLCRMLQARSSTEKWLYYALMTGAMVAALFSKINAVVFPVVLFLLAVLYPYVHGDESPDAPFELKRIRVYSLLLLPHLIVSLWVYRWYKGILTAFGFFDRGYTATLGRHVLNVVIVNPLVLWRYMQNILMPHRLTLFYHWPRFAEHYTWAQIWSSSLTLVAMVFGLIYLFIKRRDYLFFVLTVLTLMIPYLNIVYVGIFVANRYVYMSSLFLVCVVALILIRISVGGNKIMRIFGFLFLAIFFLANITQKSTYLPVWRNDTTLWTYEMSLPHAGLIPYLNLASRYYTLGIKSPDAKTREAWFSKVEDIVDRAKRDFIDPTTGKTNFRRIYRITFLSALIRIVRNDPLDNQEKALLDIERIAPGFDAVLWQLTVFYYRRSLDAKNTPDKEKYGRLAFEYYRRYFQKTPHGADFLAKDKAMRQGFRSDMPFLEKEMNASP